MVTKILLTCLVLALLAACNAPLPVDSVTPSPLKVVASSHPPETSASPLPGVTPASFNCGTIQEIPLEECQALVTLYESTNGDSWLDPTGWLVAPSPCSWYGVICQQGHVVELQLYYNQLSGSLPPEIGNLTHLKNLYLDRNQLSGPVPGEIGNLSELEVARLGGNQFSSIPTELANLHRLMYLELWGNQLSGEIPHGLGNLSQLLELRLSSNQFTGSIPPELGKLSNLTHLDLSRNQLDGPIPTALGSLSVLNELNLSYNQVSGTIPAEFGSLKNLYSLDLSYNQLTGKVPSTITNAPIGDLRLWGNLLDGTIPASKDEMTTVKYAGVHFEFPSALAESVWPETVVAQPPSDQMPFWVVGPEHNRFTLASRSVPFRTNGMGISGYPQIIIYPAQEYGAMSDLAKAEIDGLQSILATPPSVPKEKLPFLPLINAAQVFHAQEKYMDFQKGRGVRYLTQYSQDIMPITNQNIFYTFQGLTADGAYYVTATFPIRAKNLSDEPAVDDWDAFSAGYQDYLIETVKDLNSLSTNEYEPDLAVLDTLIHSLKVDAP
jgi:hypothetical protein